MIEIHDVWHHYGVRPTLRGINLTVAPGEVVCVMGPNGMGKSTLLGIAGGVLSPLTGHVKINGLIRRSSINAEREIRKQVVYLPETSWAPEHMTGREYLVGVGRLYNIEHRRLFEHIDQLFDVFDLSEKSDHVISGYSTGQKKKIYLCSALVTEAPILILDEPFSGGLDASALRTMRQILQQLAKNEKTSVLMAVPVPELVDQVAHRIAVIADGNIVALDSPDMICQQNDCESLSEALDKLTHPDRPDHLATYLNRHG